MKDEMSAEEFQAMQARRAPRGPWRANPTEHNGRRYPSLEEARMAQRLDVEIPEPDALNWWAPQVPVHLGGGRWMKVDFLVCRGGEVRAVEVKGRETREWRANRAAWPRFAPWPMDVVKAGATVETVPGRRRCCTIAR